MLQYSAILSCVSKMPAGETVSGRNSRMSGTPGPTLVSAEGALSVLSFSELFPLNKGFPSGTTPTQQKSLKSTDEPRTHLEKNCSQINRVNPLCMKELCFKSAFISPICLFKSNKVSLGTQLTQLVIQYCPVIGLQNSSHNT